VLGGALLFRPERLVEWRKNRKLTQEELAEKINATKGTISNYENGHSSPPHEALSLLANVLKVSSDYLLGLTDDPSSIANQENRTVDEQLAEIVRNNPEVGMFFKDFASSPEQKKKEMLRFWRMLELEEKDRKPGDKQGE
jgi:transcriptional regulator with XRE-family HTH domain